MKRQEPSNKPVQSLEEAKARIQQRNRRVLEKNNHKLRIAAELVEREKSARS